MVVGDVMLDQFIWGRVSRISPEAPVPVVEFERESFMPGGAANVSRNLAALKVPSDMLTLVGRDDSAQKLRSLLKEQGVSCDGVLSVGNRSTSVKTRIIAHQQQVVRVDRENNSPMNGKEFKRLLSRIKKGIPQTDAVIVGDYGKGIVNQELLDALKSMCQREGVWLSLDPKPVHHLDLSGLSLITPNRQEAFELAGMEDPHLPVAPIDNPSLITVGKKLLETLNPTLLLITLGEQGMLLFQRRRKPHHIPTVAQEVFDVSGAGDTVIASFTMAIIAGASPLEAVIFSNHAAGVVVGHVGTAAINPKELLASFG